MIDMDKLKKIDALINKNQLLESNKNNLSIYQKNINFFNKNLPAIASIIKNNKDKRFIFKKHQQKSNILDKKLGSFIYPEDINLFATKQVNKNIKNPVKHHFSIGQWNHDWAKQKKYINQIKAFQQKYTTLNDTNNHYDIVFMVGCGLGHHISLLLERKSIKHLCLFEPHPDMFIASLYHIDWQLIIENNPGTIHFFIGSDENQSLSLLSKKMGEEIPLYHMFNCYHYYHFIGDAYKKIIDSLQKKSAVIFQRFGFIEDEIISLKNTLLLFKKHYRLILNQPKVFFDKPIIIVANGPSLDNIIPFIKENKSNFLLCSCGSALSALLENKIIPDLHVIQERLTNTNQITTDENLKLCKKIIVLSLNVVSTSVIELFKDAIIGFKAHDAGFSLIGDDINTHLSPLPNTNPTVLNTALSFIIRLGFNKILLAGADFGASDKKKHHSKSSLYYTKNMPLGDYDCSQLSIKTKGKDESIIYTSSIFLSSLLQIENLISLYPRVTVYNVSNGVKIKNATFITHQELLRKTQPSNSVTVSNKAILASILNENTNNNYLKQNLLEKVTTNLNILEKHTLGISHIKISECLNIYTETIYRQLESLKKPYPLAYYLAAHSHFYMISLIYMTTYSNTKDKQKNIFNTCLDIYKAFIDEVIVALKKDEALQ